MKPLTVILCLFCYYFSRAQLSIDSIKTEADEEAFVSAYGKQNGYNWNNVTVRGLKQSPVNGQQNWVQKIDSQTNRKWIIEDFNNDGRKDLVFNSIIDDNLYLFSLLSNGNVYTFFDLQNWYYKSAPVDLFVLKNNSTTLLLKTEASDVNENIKWVKGKRTDTLMALAGGFIEFYKKERNQSTFKSLHFKFEPTGNSSDMLFNNKQTLTITSDRKVVYNRLVSTYNRANDLDDLNVHYVTAISDDIKSQLIDLLTLMNVQKMKDSFYVGGTHYPEARIKIRTVTGVKNIYDYGLEGTYGLRLLYKQLFTIIRQVRAIATNYFSGHDHWNN